MSIHHDYTWELKCPACNGEINIGLKKEDHKEYSARFAVKEMGMFMTSQAMCRACAAHIEIRKAMSVYGVMTVGILNMRDTEVNVDYHYPVEFTPPETVPTYETSD